MGVPEGVTEVSEEDSDHDGGARVKVKRASIKFKSDTGGDFEELRIENDRMKTTLMVLTQKLKLKEEDKKQEDEKWLSQIRELEFESRAKSDEINDLKSQMHDKTAENEELEAII